MVAPTSSIETPVLVHELGPENVLVQSLLRPALAAVGNAADARLELALLLEEHFARLRPADLARFDLATPALRSVRVRVPNAGLQGRLQVKTELDVTCLTTPAQSQSPAPVPACWVHLALFDAAVYLPAGADFESVVRAEVERLARGRELQGTEYLALLPAARTSVESLEVPLGRSAGGTQALSSLRQQVSAQQRREAEGLLSTIGRPFHAQSRARPVLSRDRELVLLESVLGGTARMSVLLLGEAGAGKSALFAGWYEARRERDASPLVYVTSAAQWVSGTGGMAQSRARLERVLAAAELLDAVLYVEDLHDLLLSRRGGTDDLAAFVRPWLEAGRVRFVGELRSESLDAAERRDPGFLAALTRVVATPLPVGSALPVLQAHAAYHRRHEPHLPQIGPDALDALCELAERYVPYGVLPGSVLRLYDELRAVDRGHGGHAGALVGAMETYAWFSARSGVPLFLLRDDVSLRRQTLEREFDRLLVGQQGAKRAVIDTVCVIKARLAPRDKPLASFLFVGPTGVGKTELARALSQVLFSDAERMVRFDMSEYAGPYAAERLIRGSDRSDGLLTRKVREQPFSVVLLDEIEKADASVYDLLLQVLGEARLTDARGRTAYFHNCIVIMTSNLGGKARSSFGFTQPERGAGSQYLDAARETFRPEFLNRIDRIVPFSPLARSELLPVVELLVARVLERRGLREAGLQVDLSPGALVELADGGFTDAYGARGVRRHLESALVAPLARLCAVRARWPAADAIEVVLQRDVGDEPLDPLTMLVAGALRFRAVQRAHGQSDGHSGRSATELEVTRLRRRLSRWLHLSRVLELRDERDALVAELAQASRARGFIAHVVAALEARYHRLCALLDPMDAAYEEVCATEELCLSALHKGEAPARFDQELMSADSKFRRALLKALVVDEPGCHSVTLLLTELDDQRALDPWLSGYLAQAGRLGHSIRLRVDAGGTGARFSGPAYDAAEALEQVLAPERSFRHVLLSAEGPEALILLGLEAGRVCYRRANSTEASIGVVLIARFTGLTEHELGAPAVQPPSIAAIELMRRAKPSRLFDELTGTVQIASLTTMALRASEHFARIEEVALAHLLLFESSSSIDRDNALSAAMVREKRP